MAPIHHHFEKKGWADHNSYSFLDNRDCLSFSGLATLKLSKYVSNQKLKELSFRL